MRGRLVNTLPFTLERVRVICESSRGVRSDLLFPYDPTPGEATEWTWMHTPMQAEFAYLLDWRVPFAAMRKVVVHADAPWLAIADTFWRW